VGQRTIRGRVQIHAQTRGVGTARQHAIGRVQADLREGEPRQFLRLSPPHDEPVLATYRAS
jgi:hypothetical protein